MKRFVLTIFTFLPAFSFLSFAQDLTGIWRGYFITDDGEQYRYEVQIEHTRSTLSGVTYSYLDKRFYGKATFTGNYNKPFEVNPNKVSPNAFPLKKGSKGKEVRLLQEALIVKYGKNILPRYGADSDFGTEMINALQKLGLSSIIDENTFNTLTGNSSTSNTTSNDGKALLQEIKTVEVRMSSLSFGCIQKCLLSYEKSGNEEFLEGTFTSIIEKTDTIRGVKRGTDCGGGKMVLRKVPTSDFYVEPFLRKKNTPVNNNPPLVKNNPPTNNNSTAKIVPKPTVTTPNKNNSTATNKNSVVIKPKTDTVKKAEVNLPQPEDKKDLTIKPNTKKPDILKKRENSLVQTLTINSENVTVKLYDNGEIDDDTISVYLDNKLILSNKRLSAAAITVNLKMDESNPDHELIMVAENLGRIPPNTSLMIVTAGDQRFEVRITSTEQKNAMVRFKYVKSKVLYRSRKSFYPNKYFHLSLPAMRAASFLLIVFIISFNSTAQNLNGVWRGTLTQGPGGCFSVYNIELNIKTENGKVNGASYHYSDVTNYVKEDFGGSYNSANKILSINENKVLTFHVPPDCIPCIKQYNLEYQKQDNKEVLTGDWGGVTMNNYASCPPGKITLSRVAESDFEHIKEIKVDTGTIRLDFYDNAQIDGDIISVLLNNKPLASNQKLTSKPITLEIKVDLNNREQEITMVAENLGDIPPNTALLIITAGNKRYQLHLTSTEKKNAQVRFIYEEPQKNN